MTGASHSDPAVVVAGGNVFEPAHSTYVYNWVQAQALSSQPPQGSRYVVHVDGLVPCCIPSMVPGTEGEVPVGDVLGTCDPTLRGANITWLGSIVPQLFDQARLLTVDLVPIPGVWGGPCEWGGGVASRAVPSSIETRACRAGCSSPAAAVVCPCASRSQSTAMAFRQLLA